VIPDQSRFPNPYGPSHWDRKTNEHPLRGLDPPGQGLRPKTMKHLMMNLNTTYLIEYHTFIYNTESA